MITLLSIIALGFFLGMRHATDPDHVIAVTTIVSRQRSIRHAALIGILWGLGHTITIFLVARPSSFLACDSAKARADHGVVRRLDADTSRRSKSKRVH